MFCHKCGAQNPEGAGFCIKCGAKLILEEPQQAVPAPVNPQQGPAVPVSQQPVQPAPSQQSVPLVIPGVVPAAPAMPPKKKSKKKLIILGSVLLVVVIGLIAVVSLGDWTDYVATVKAYTPFYKSHELPYTYEEVLGKYLSDVVWTTEKDGSGANVTVDGIGTGTDTQITFTIGVMPDTSQRGIVVVKISPKSAVIGDEKVSTQDETTDILNDFFTAYSKDFKDYAAIREEMDSAKRRYELTETFTNEKEGISFRYPEALMMMDVTDLWEGIDEGWTAVASGADFGNTLDDTIYQMKITKITDRELADKVFADEAKFLESFGYNVKEVTEVETEISELNGTKVRMVNAGTQIEDYPPEIVQGFVYRLGDTVYRVVLSCAEENADNFADLFRQITDSYKVTAPEPTPTPAPTPTPKPTPAPTPEPNDSYATVREFLNDPDVQSEIDAMTEELGAGSGMQLSIDASDDTLFYIFEFNAADLFDADLNAVTRNLEDGLQSQADTFVGIAQAISDVVDVDNVKVVVIYKISTGNELCRREFSAY